MRIILDENIARQIAQIITILLSDINIKAFSLLDLKLQGLKDIEWLNKLEKNDIVITRDKRIRTRLNEFEVDKRKELSIIFIKYHKNIVCL